VLADNPDAVQSYAAGEKKAVGFLVGQVMTKTQGKADPRIVNALLGARLDR
jgi:aspartyl-tRNA(Asn)/glutamyl-tRNA(Gln) amidotransferase subunit B